MKNVTKNILAVCWGGLFIVLLFFVFVIVFSKTGIILKGHQKIKSALVVTIIPEHLGYYDNRLKREAIIKILKHLDIRHYIDLFSLLKDDMDKYYLKTDDHLSSAGHAVVAESVVDYINKNNLLKSSFN